MSAQFDHWADIGKARTARGSNQRAGQTIVVKMHGEATAVANQEDAIVLAAGVAVGDIGVRALDPASEIGSHEDIEDAVDAVRRDPLAAQSRDAFGDVIG